MAGSRSTANSIRVENQHTLPGGSAVYARITIISMRDSHCRVPLILQSQSCGKSKPGGDYGAVAASQSSAACTRILFTVQGRTDMKRRSISQAGAIIGTLSTNPSTNLMASKVSNTTSFMACTVLGGSLEIVPGQMNPGFFS